MGSDGKLLPIPLSAGIDQSMDEFAAPPGTIRRSINTRVRQGGSLEQRRGVHGFELMVPSYMANFQATGAVEFVSGVAETPFVGVAGKVYGWSSGQQRAFFLGNYSQYQPLQRKTAFLTEEQYGFSGARQVAVAYDSAGNEFTVLASCRADRLDVRVLNSAGATVSAFSWPVVDAFLLELAPFGGGVHLVVTSRDGVVWRVESFRITLGASVAFRHENTYDTVIAPGGVAACPVPGGSVPGGTPPHAIIAFSDGGVSGNLVVQDWIQTSDFAQDRRIRHAVPSGTDFASLLSVHQHKSSQFAMLAYTQRTSSGNPTPTGGVFYRVVSYNSGSPIAVATGTLVGAARGYSAPILGSGNKPNEFLWAVSNGQMIFGRVTVPTGGPAVVSQDGAVRAVPLSTFDEFGACWVLDDSGEAAPVPRASRALLVKYPDPSRQGDGVQSPLVQLSASRQAPAPFIAALTWHDQQSQYSRPAQSTRSISVMLPLQLRSQASGLYSMEVYEYQHSSQTEFMAVRPATNKMVIGGQPVEAYLNPNAGGVYWASGVATMMAKANLAAEVGFPTEPYIATMATASGTRIAPGQRLYSAVFEWISPAGERHRSRPATPVTVVNSTSAGLAPYAPPQFMSQRFPSPRIHYYRTIAGEKQFLRVSPDSGVPIGEQFYDHNSDDEIRDNEVLYTDGGVQPNDLAPSCRFMALGEDRLWLGGLFESDIVQCSKVFVPREPVQFSDLDSFKMRLPFPCTGLAYLDGSLVAFCESSTYLISGTGPNNQGVGGFTLRPIADNVGCIDHRSIVTTSIGVFFQAKRGIHLMPRGFGSPEQIRNLNELMGDFGDGFTEVIGATTRDYSDEETVRFLLRNPSTNRRIVATYELGTSTWNYDVIRDENGNDVPLSAIGDGPEGVVYGAGSGTYRFLTELEGLAGTPYDSMGSTVNRFLSEVHLSKMSVFGPAGEGKVKGVNLRGFAPATGAQVSLSLVTDYGTQTHTFSGIASGTFFRRVVPALQDSSEMQISATFSTGVGRKTGLKLLSLTLELEPKPGARRARQGEQE